MENENNDKMLSSLVKRLRRNNGYTGANNRRPVPLDAIKLLGLVAVLITAALSIGALYNKVSTVEKQRIEDRRAFIDWNARISERLRDVERRP